MFANGFKRHTSHVYNSRLARDLLTSANDRGISRGFYFHENLRNFVKIKFSRKFPSLQNLSEPVTSPMGQFLSLNEFSDDDSTWYNMDGLNYNHRQ